MRSPSPLLIWVLGLLPCLGWAQPLVQHALVVSLQPQAHTLQVEDRITLPQEIGAWRFALHAGLEPTSPTAGVQLQRLALPPAAKAARVPLAYYQVRLPPGQRRFVLRYGGPLYHPLPAQEAAYARGFRDTPGLIAAEGVVLSGATAWYPQADDALVAFTLEVQLPPGWEAISQGRRTLHERSARRTRVRWEEAQPQEQIVLVAGPFTEYRQAFDRVEAMAFLRTPDAALAQRYLQATGRYVALYERLLGPYPYAKFALVENFWESGYGLPSFTLLGAKVIRFPFILHTSYPHEILHNWWGNGVYVDESGGNWSEGLTAYLADHLLQEQRGTAARYRRTTLQKYADYVSAHRDFPLVAFRARHDAASEAVGYGKALMVFHMLRQQLGDAVFLQALRAFYRDYRFRRASFADLQRVFSRQANTDLTAFFEQWLQRPGAPQLRLEDVAVQREGDGYVLRCVLAQAQPGPAYALRVPLAVTLEGAPQAFVTTVSLTAARQPVALRLPARPLRLDVDPAFDVFRRLHPEEVPPALSRLFGAEQVVILLPAAAPAPLRQAYAELARTWQAAAPGQVALRWDEEVEALPAAAVWLFGWENRWRPQLEAALAPYGVRIEDGSVRLGDHPLRQDQHTLVLVAPRAGGALAWLAAAQAAVLPDLGRRLPHYGKYSYLAFQGEAAVVKGQWPVVHSPLTAFLAGQAVPAAPLPPRPALAARPAFSAARMLADVRQLADEALEGRGFGTLGLDRAADLLAAKFLAAGLQPAGERPGSYFQSWKARGGAPERDVVLKNVVGRLPGSDPAYAAQPVVVGAHYDHLGHGWPDVHQGDEGKVHPGADDNASGVAVLLELARVLGERGPLPRPVVFVAFAGEEAGRLGSRHYAARACRPPAARCLAMLNLDTVGRLQAKPLLVLGSGSAREWPQLFTVASAASGVAVRLVPDDWGASDQRSFLEAGVPAVQLTSGPHPDYHRPTDTADKIDAAGLERVARLAYEVVVALATRAAPLTATLDTSRQEDVRAPPRRVRLGTVPDFTYPGPGCRLEGVIAGSPAARAGLRAGDVIVRLGAVPIADLRGFAAALRALRPGDAVRITFLRNGAEHTVQAQVEAR